jgi:hypothetical protein
VVHFLVMKLLILYRPKSEEARNVESFIHDFKSRHEEGRLEIVDVDSRDGIATATLYDVMRYPAILALREDGSVLKSWEGDTLPLMDEVAYYAFSQG